MPDGIRKYKYMGLSIFMLGSVLFMNCSEEKKHDMLTFFFDGVPSLGQARNNEESVNANFRATSQVPEGPVWYVHEPRKDCSNCHDKNRQQSMSRQTYLKAPVPALCYNCHSDYTSSYQYVHGPVAVGQCLYCHNPHASKINHLLIEPEPELCYKCHDQYAVELIPAHFSKQMSMCTNCHDPHASSIRAFLKIEPESISEIYSGRPLGQTDTIPVTQQDRENLLQIFSDVNKLIDNGDLQKARLYLNQFKDNSAFSAQEKEKINEILKLLDETSARNNESSLRNTNSEIETGENNSSSRNEEIAELYYRSLELYRNGELIRARQGFIDVINSGLIPSAMEITIKGYLADIDSKLANQNN